MRAIQIEPWPTASLPPSRDPWVWGLGTKKSDSPEIGRRGVVVLGTPVRGHRDAAGTRSRVNGVRLSVALQSHSRLPSLSFSQSPGEIERRGRGGRRFGGAEHASSVRVKMA